MNWAKWSNDHCYCFVGRLVSHGQNGFVHYMHINRKKKGARSTVGQCLRPTGVYLQLVCRRRRVRVCMSHAFNLNVCVCGVRCSSFRRCKEASRVSSVRLCALFRAKHAVDGRGIVLQFAPAIHVRTLVCSHAHTCPSFRCSRAAEPPELCMCVASDGEDIRKGGMGGMGGAHVSIEIPRTNTCTRRLVYVLCTGIGTAHTHTKCIR